MILCRPQAVGPPFGNAFHNTGIRRSRHKSETSYYASTPVRESIADFDWRIAAADTDAENARLRVERRQLGHYASFPFDEKAERIRAGLDKE